MRVFFFIFFFLSQIANGQFISCHIDSTLYFNLTCEFSVSEIDGSSVTSNYFITNSQNENCQLYRFDWKTHFVIDEEGKRLFKCPNNQITSLKINLFNLISNDYVFHLDTFGIFNSLNLPALRHLIIGEGNYYLNFKKWYLFSELSKIQSLETIEIKGNVINTDWFVPFQSFDKVRIINIEQYFSVQYNLFPSLERLNMNNTYFFFSNSIIDIPFLIEMPSYHAQTFRCNDLYPEVSFFCNESSPDIIGHPFYEINKVVKEKLKYTPTYSGMMTVTINELELGLIDEQGQSDTIARGTVYKGQPIGRWDFKLSDYQFFGSPWFYYDYDQKEKINYPIDGDWNYYYSNGVIAIKGQFKSGKKHGEWKFYNPDGELSSVKSFVLGDPKGLFINYEPNPEGLKQNRAYVYSPNLILTGWEMMDGSFRVGNGYNPYYPGNKYALNSYGQLKLFQMGKFVKEIKKNSWRYNRTLKKYLRKLYPDKKLNIKDLSFES